MLFAGGEKDARGERRPSRPLALRRERRVDRSAPALALLVQVDAEGDECGARLLENEALVEIAADLADIDESVPRGQLHVGDKNDQPGAGKGGAKVGPDRGVEGVAAPSGGL